MENDFEAELRSRDPDDFLRHAFQTIATSGDAAVLESMARWAVEREVTLETSSSYSQLKMVEGAARARAAMLSGQAAEVFDEEELVERLNDLQDKLDEEGDRGGCLDLFGPLGARILAMEVPSYFGSQIHIEEDDSLYYWVGGAIALKGHLAAT